MTKPAPLSAAERAARRRAKLRAQGLRRKEFWAPDVRTPEFKAQARREALATANNTSAEDWAFIESVQYWPQDDEV